MLKSQAIVFFGGKSKLADAAGVKPPSVSAWGELVPEGRAARLVAASNGVLKYDPEFYDKYRAKRRKDLNDENHQQP